MTEFFPIETFSEDCLTLNIWAPHKQFKLMPVFVWFFGGGFTQGGTSSRFFNPQSWVQRTREHIVVTVNFRSNIFGFPNAAALEDQNLGLLDQRLALEWVRDNIANFGGDPSKIVDWGESAGAIAVDYLNLAYSDDPIVSGSIMESGTALFDPTSNRLTSDTFHNNFTTVARAFNCTMPTSQIDCLRNISWQSIER
jgi:acetylcholinesterase